jgi:hypothetical protein
MNSLAFRLKLPIVAGLVVQTSFGVLAQGAASRATPGVSATMIRLFGDIAGFSAKAEVQLLDSAQKEILSMPLDFALLDKKIRVEVDMSKMKSQDLSPQNLEWFKERGMIDVVSVIAPDKIYVYYPARKIMLCTVSSPEAASAEAKSPKLTQTELGKETLDGHPCIKKRALLTDERGRPIEAMTWNATDLKGFPIQIQIRDKESTSFVRFKQVQLAKPDAKQFEPPAGYTQFASEEKLVEALMK